HLYFELTLQVADLSGREIVVENDDVRIGSADHQFELLNFTLAEIRGLVWDLALLGEAADDFGTSGFYEARELVQVVAGSIAIGQLDADQDGRLALDAPPVG